MGKSLRGVVWGYNMGKKINLAKFKVALDRIDSELVRIWNEKYSCDLKDLPRRYNDCRAKRSEFKLKEGKRIFFIVLTFFLTMYFKGNSYEPSLPAFLSVSACIILFLEWLLFSQSISIEKRNLTESLERTELMIKNFIFAVNSLLIADPVAITTQTIIQRAREIHNNFSENQITINRAYICFERSAESFGVKVSELTLK